MKKTAVIGLGIIGGSICASLTKAGYAVDGTDINAQSVEYALRKGYIKARALDISDYDAVFLALPPRETLSLINTLTFKENALVCDICGIKTETENAVFAFPRNYRYIGVHPMAGKESSGILSASPDLFHYANLIIVRAEQTQESAIAEIKEYANAMRFGNIIQCSAKEHDKKIALTSQLAHILSNVYVKSPQVQDCEGFTGGSFQDMTRIAGVDERVWTQLYLGNREYLLEELEYFLQNLQQYQEALLNNDEEKLAELLKEGRIIREKIKYKRN